LGVISRIKMSSNGVKDYSKKVDYLIDLGKIERQTKDLLTAYEIWNEYRFQEELKKVLKNVLEEEERKNK
jgi:hypothetical protein